MKTLLLLVIAIAPYTGSDTTRCIAVNLETGDTGTLYNVFDGCIMVGDTIKIPYEDKRRNTK